MTTEESGNAISNYPIPKVSVKSYYSPGMIGLFVGIPSLFLVSFISFGGSLCDGILISIVIGGIAGWFTGRHSNIGHWANATEFGGKSGLIAGLFVLFGHIVGGILRALLLRLGGVLGVFPNTGTPPFAELNSIFIRQGIINGVIGLVVTWISAAVVAPKVYEMVQKESR
jgi:hypothetical protein